MERFAQAPGRLGRTARDNTNREHIRQGAPDEREGAYRFASARSSACSWDHSLGWAPRPKTKVRGKKFCAGEYFLGERSHWMGRAFLGLGPGSGIKAAATGRQPEKSTKSRVVDESGCKKHSGPTGGAPQRRKLRRGCLRRLSRGPRNPRCERRAGRSRRNGRSRQRRRRPCLQRARRASGNCWQRFRS